MWVLLVLAGVIGAAIGVFAESNHVALVLHFTGAHFVLSASEAVLLAALAGALLFAVFSLALGAAAAYRRKKLLDALSAELMASREKMEIIEALKEENARLKGRLEVLPRQERSAS